MDAVADKEWPWGPSKRSYSQHATDFVGTTGLSPLPRGRGCSEATGGAAYAEGDIGSDREIPASLPLFAEVTVRVAELCRRRSVHRGQRIVGAGKTPAFACCRKFCSGKPRRRGPAFSAPCSGARSTAGAKKVATTRAGITARPPWRQQLAGLQTRGHLGSGAGVEPVACCHQRRKGQCQSSAYGIDARVCGRGQWGLQRRPIVCSTGIHVCAVAGPPATRAAVRKTRPGIRRHHGPERSLNDRAVCINSTAGFLDTDALRPGIDTGGHAVDRQFRRSFVTIRGQSRIRAERHAHFLTAHGHRGVHGESVYRS